MKGGGGGAAPQYVALARTLDVEGYRTLARGPLRSFSVLVLKARQAVIATLALVQNVPAPHLITVTVRPRDS